MSWAARRRAIILFLLGAAVTAFVAVLLIATFSEAPSCRDGVQNQDESGVDCGGSCAYLCVDQQHPPTILFTKAIPNGAGRTDIVALVENRNGTAAAKQVPYIVTLYGAGQVFVQQVTGTIDLPPLSTTPVFIPGVASGNQKTIRAFLTIDDAAPQWYSFSEGARIKPLVVNTTFGGATTSPRIDAVLANSNVAPTSNVRVLVFVYDDTGEVIAASQTIVPQISAQGQATATFTWNTAFTGTPAKIEVRPIVPL